MNKNDQELMKEYGITCVNKAVYSYKQHHYDRLSDAVNYAQIDCKENLKHGPNMPEDEKLSRDKLV